MRARLRQLWDDDRGAVVTVELLLIVSILMFGLIPGLVAMRNSANAALTSLGNLIVSLVPSVTFSGFSIVGTNANGIPVTILRIGGFEFTPDRPFLTADQLAPEVLPNTITIPPAP